ncbi:similarity to S. pombe hypothetical protein (nucleomorph) [Guillardia theta]|uniref:Uncharacterized protein n=1 Tax=Guillardia theta TaxID=55529 RepID=Q98RW4_GUITH|nr:similarity to S. pombe hypothetical protein [Guillardia theta]AAK39836.1 similarity to S. pombe hypothetical protein [Guillardia theta]|mmetsp:Transcript_37597/g.118701  ORF Transcript_37597/g.118701 Transcript_37597/m.118701 type:complete len:557 (+) Transcript_37597:96-1766(+)
MIKPIVSIIGAPKSGKNTLFRTLEKTIKNDIILKSKNLIEFKLKNEFDVILLKDSNEYFSFFNLVDISDILFVMIDAYFGIEYELFEVISVSRKKKIKIVFILSHLDIFTNWKNLKKAKKTIKNRILSETNIDSKFTYLSGIKTNGFYYEKEIRMILRIFEKNILEDIHSRKKFFIFINPILFSKTKNIFKGFLIGTKMDKKTNKGYITNIGDIEIISFDRLNYFHYYQKFRLNLNKKENTFTIFVFSFLYCYNYKDVTDYSPEEKLTNEKIDSTIIIKKIYKPDFYKDIFLNKNIKKKKTKSKNFYYIWKITFKISCISKFKYFNSDSHLIFTFKNTKNERCVAIVAKIKKHKWCKKILESHSKYLIWISFYLFYSQVILCKQNSKNLNIIKNKSKTTKFLNIVLYGREFNAGSTLIGIDKTTFCVNNFRQNTFLILFSGCIIKCAKKLKIFNKFELNYKIIKTFKKTGLLKIKNTSNINFSSLIGSLIFTKNKNKGIVKSLKSSKKFSVLRASFIKTLNDKDEVYSKIWIPIKTNFFYQDLNVFLPFDFKEINL